MNTLELKMHPHLNTVKRYLAAGWRLGFTSAGLKVPTTQHGVKDFSNDHAVLEAWLASLDGKANLLGTPPEFTAVLDCDIYKVSDEAERAKVRASVLEFINRTGANAVQSARGGIHIVVDDDAQLNNATIRALFGCPGEVKRHMMGYVVLPGSTFEGKTYRFIPGHEIDGRDPPRVPALTPTIVTATPAPSAPAPDGRPSEAPTGNELRDMLWCVPADDYFEWITVGMALQHVYGDEYGFRVWNRWSELSDKYPGEEALREKWKSFKPEGKDKLVSLGTLYFYARKNGYGRSDPQADFGPQGWFASHSVANMLALDAPGIDWVLHKAVMRGKVALLAGMGGTGKSYMAYRFGLYHAAQRKSALGYFGTDLFDPPLHASTGKTLVLSAEDDADDLHRRVQSMVRTLDFSAEERALLGQRMAMVPVATMPTRIVGEDDKLTKFAQRVIDECNAAGPVDLLILDPGISFSGSDVNSAGEVTTFMRGLLTIAQRTQAAVLVVAHVRKRGAGSMVDSTVDDVLGSVAFTNAARGVFMYTRMTAEQAVLYGVPPDDAGRYVGLSVHKNNYAAHKSDEIWWFVRAEDGTPMPVEPPLQRVAHSAQAREVAKAKARVVKEKVVKRQRHDDNVLAMLQSIQQMPSMGRTARAVHIQISDTACRNLLTALLEDKLIKLTTTGGVVDGKHTPNTYELTKAGLVRLQTGQK
jgi:RecA-family ATPase